MKSDILGNGWLPYFNKLVEWGVHEDDAIFYLGVINSEYLGDFSYDEEDPFEDNEYLDWNDRESIINDFLLIKEEFEPDYNYYRYDVWKEEKEEE